MPLAPAKCLHHTGMKIGHFWLVRILSTKNLSTNSNGVSLPEDNPKNVDEKAHCQYPFNRKILIIDSFQSQNSRQELEINSPMTKYVNNNQNL